MSANVFRPGDTCGGHEVVRLLGSGGFAQVYEVIDEAGARRALKTLAAEAEALPKLRARLAQEGAVLALIEHPNVVRLFDAGIHEDRIFLLLELVHGMNLREALRERRPDPLTAAGWIQKACEGLAAAHRAGVVHRDLKPENILVAAPDVVKVIDFGIAKLSSFGVKTTKEQRVGTAMYMSPEQIQGGAPDPRMDVYSMGLVLYEVLAGQHPIVAGPATMIEICARQLNHRPAPITTAAPWVAPDLAALVDRAVEKDKDRRPPSMRAFADALAEALARAPVSAPIASGPSPDGPTPVIETGALGIARRYGGTVKMAAVAVRPPARFATTAPLSPSAAFAPTAPIAETAPVVTAPVVTAPITTAETAPAAETSEHSEVLMPAAPADLTTAPLPPDKPVAAAVPAPTAQPAEARPSRAPVVIAAIAALVIGVLAGTFSMMRILAAIRDPTPAPPSTSAHTPAAKPPASPHR
ncbi:MAG: protein kinase [Minicystis sp.]